MEERKMQELEMQGPKMQESRMQEPKMEAARTLRSMFEEDDGVGVIEVVLILVGIFTP